jgi:hypothetical protein
LIAGEGYRIVYVPPQDIPEERLIELAQFIEGAISPCEVRGVTKDQDELEITVYAKPGCEKWSTHWLYNQVVGAVRAFLAGEPVPVPSPSPSPTGMNIWIPIALVAGAVALWALTKKKE